MKLLPATFAATFTAAATFAATFASLAWAQGGPVQQSGPITPGHVPSWITNGVIGDGGSALNGKLKELGITNTGTPFCITDAPTTGPYHQLCLGADALGGGLLTYNAYGGAAPLPFNCVINGNTIQDCLKGGAAGVFGPGHSTIGEITSWANTTGTLLRQGPARITGDLIAAQTADAAIITGLTQPGISANQIWQWITCPSACPGKFTVDAMRGVTVAPLGSTSLVNAVAGYLVNDNNNASPLGQSAIVGAYGISRANNAETWGFNSILSDNEYLTPSTGVGKHLYNEFDLAITNPNTVGGGLLIGPGTWLVQPAGVNGISIETPWGTNLTGPSAPFPRWNIGLFMQDGCCINGLVFGAQHFTPTAGDPSQYISMNYRDDAGAPQTITLGADYDAGGRLFVGGTHGSGVEIPAGNGANGLVLNAANPPGPTNPSQYMILNYTDSANALKNYAFRADAASGALDFTGTSVAPTYQFNGTLKVTGVSSSSSYTALGVAGVTCSGAPTGSFATTGGIVTHC